MKNKLSMLAALLLLASGSALAQLNVSTNTIEYEDTRRPCIEVLLQPGTDEVKEEWRDFVKDEYDVKMKGIGFLANKDVLRAEEVTIEAISPKAMNFFTRVVEDGDQTKMCVFGSFGYDIHISPENSPREWNAMETMVGKFLNQYLPEFYDDKIEDTQERLTDLQERQKELQEDIAENRKKIEELTSENEKMQKELTEKEKAAVEVSRDLTQRKADYSQVKQRLQSLKIQR